MPGLKQCIAVRKRLGGRLMTSPISALVINLASSPERLAFQQQQLAYLDIAWQALAAVDVNDVSESDYEQMANGWERKLRKTEVACFLSHKKAWQWVVRKNTPVLILEDDALLSKHSANLLQSLADNTIAQTADHITLEIRNRKKLLAKEHHVVNASFSLTRLFQDRAGAAAYVLYPSGAKKLLEKTHTHAPALADAFICSHYGLRSYQVIPAAAIQSDQCEFYGIDIHQKFPSTIAKSVKDKPQVLHFAKKARFKLRRLVGQLQMGWRQLCVVGKSSRVYVKPRKRDFLR